jgi:hypothetical protein
MGNAESRAKDPCIGCGEPTAVGTLRYSDRRAIDHSDKSRSYLCSLCDARVAAARRGKRLSDDEVRRLIESGSMAGVIWSGGTPGGSSGPSLA